MRKEMLGAYRLKVADVFRSVEGAAEFNGTIDHARIVTEEAFSAAGCSVFVLMHSAASEQFNCDAVVRAAQGFLEKDGSHLRVLCERDFNVKTSAFASAVSECKNVEVRFVPQGVQRRYPFNFFTFDRKGFRFQDDRTVPMAMVGCGNTYADTVTNLDKVFEEIWGLSQASVAEQREAAAH
jgi:hypothetical protein